MGRGATALLVAVVALVLPAVVLAAGDPVVETGDSSFASQPDGSTQLTLTGRATLAAETPGATYRFEYGRTEAYGATTEAFALPPAPGPHIVSATMPMPDGAGVRYVFRLVVEVGDQVYAAAPRAFTTRFPEPDFRECRVPELRSLRLARARHRLRAADCRLGTVRRLPRRRSTDAAARTVRRQSPRPGRTRDAGARVDVVLR